MRHLQLLAALTIALCVTGCALFSHSPAPPLSQAQAQMDRRLDCPPPPPELSLCQDQGLPVLAVKDGSEVYWCPPPRSLLDALANAPIKDVAAQAEGWALKETDLRFKSLHWFDQCRAPSQASSADAGAAQ